MSRNLDTSILPTNEEIYEEGFKELKIKYAEIKEKHPKGINYRFSVPLQEQETFRSLKDYNTITISIDKFQGITTSMLYAGNSIVGNFTTQELYKLSLKEHYFFFKDSICIKIRTEDKGAYIKLTIKDEYLLTEHFIYENGSGIELLGACLVNQDLELTIVNSLGKDTDKLSPLDKKKHETFLDKATDGISSDAYKAVLLLKYITDELNNRETIIKDSKGAKNSANVSNENRFEKNTSKSIRSKKVYNLDDMLEVTLYKKNGSTRLTHWKNRPHEVRGFYRTYKSGKVVWVKPHERGKNSKKEKIVKEIKI